MLSDSSDIAGGLPCELDVVLSLLGLACLSVDTLHNVAVCELPLALALGLVVIELALKACAVGVAPLTGDELPVGPLPNVFHSCLEEHISALTVFLALLPLT